MPFSEVHIAPDVKRVIESLRGDLREKVKNALREISLREDSGTAVSLMPATLRLYKAGRFRILFRRTNGTVWVDALMLDGAACSSAGRRGASHATMNAAGGRKR